jgi:hypothetical protein
MLLDSRVKPFDVTGQFPEGWQQDTGAIAIQADFRDFAAHAVLVPGSLGRHAYPRGRVHGVQVQPRLPWLYKLYRDHSLQLAGQAWSEPIEAAVDGRYGIVLNVQQGNKMRFECHVVKVLSPALTIPLDRVAPSW